ncbi:MAG: aspartate aminotransferase family protein [Scytonematopsis contorta HA4267-MV1]|jgi:glutamate-1-semialdehyde-2,1-aminomutase|nr:aspartate aminotransferase family protein [Scytonematopsis contorta HA4267-MV1]
MKHQQNTELETFIQNYIQITKASKEIAQKFRLRLADNRSPLLFSLPLKEISYSIVGKRSSGSKIWDIEGNEYIDLMMGYGVNLFGHNPIFIKQAIADQLEEGIHLGIQSEVVGEVAELICELTQMERVTFSNTGTEAIITAIRLARTITNRHKIALFSGSYHGHSDGTLVKTQLENETIHTVPMAPGIPLNIAKDVLVLDYGNPHSLDIIKDNERELAAVLVEPVQTSQLNIPSREFLQQLRQLTKEADIALIFDEMISGFRIHPGGAQAWFGIKADLATYGKIVGGGMPIGVIAGKATYMDAIDGGMWNYGDASYPQVRKTFFAGTYCKHPLAMAAARAVLKHLKTCGVSLQQQLNQRTSQFAEDLSAYFEEDKLPFQVKHFGSLFGLNTIGSFQGCKDTDLLDFRLVLLYYNLLYRGILLRGNGGFLSTAHTDEDINSVIQAIKDSITNLRKGGFI